MLVFKVNEPLRWTKEIVKESGREGDGGLEEGGYPKSDEMIRWIESSCNSSQVDPAILVNRDKPQI